jgi:hypothetical protein
VDIIEIHVSNTPSTLYPKRFTNYANSWLSYWDSSAPYPKKTTAICIYSFAEQFAESNRRTVVREPWQTWPGTFARLY